MRRRPAPPERRLLPGPVPTLARPAEAVLSSLWTEDALPPFGLLLAASTAPSKGRRGIAFGRKRSGLTGPGQDGTEDPLTEACESCH